MDKVNSYQCICKEGWEGEICSISMYYIYISISKSVSISTQRDFHNMIYDMATFNNIRNFKLPSCYTNIHLQEEKFSE